MDQRLAHVRPSRCAEEKNKDERQRPDAANQSCHFTVLEASLRSEKREKTPKFSQIAVSHFLNTDMKDSIAIYRPRQQWSIWCGFGSAVLIHLLAIRLAAGRVETLAVAEPTPPVSGEVELNEITQPPDPPDFEPPPPPAVQDADFVDDRAIRVKPVRPRDLVRRVGAASSN